MSFNEVLIELESLSVTQRQLVIRRALELDDPGLSLRDEALVTKRLEEHHRRPETSISLDEMKARVRSRKGK
jgi:hypothetical protein